MINKQMKTFNEFINEEKNTIYLDGVPLIWNTNKSDDEWLERIHKRTRMNEVQFCEVVQQGIEAASDICSTGDTCISFIKSQFVLVVNKRDSRIITVRDGKWDKPTNGKCNRTFVAELEFDNDEQQRDFVTIYEGKSEQEWGYIGIGESSMGARVTYNCKCCNNVDY